MNWPFILKAAVFGLLFALYAAGNSILVLGAMPDAFSWLKIGAGSVIAFVIGVFTFTRDPEAAWKAGPGK